MKFQSYIKSIDKLRYLRVAKYKYDKFFKISKLYYEYNIDIKQLKKNLNIEKNMLQNTISKIHKHMYIMGNKGIELNIKEKTYLDITFLDKFYNYFIKTFNIYLDKIKEAAKEKETIELNYELLFYDKTNNENILDITRVTGDVLILYSLVEEYTCHINNINNYLINLEKYENNNINISIVGREYPEFLLKPRLTQSNKKISTEENFNLVAKFSSFNLNLQDKKINKIKHYEQGFNYLDPLGFDYKTPQPKNSLLNKQGNFFEGKYDIKYHSNIKFISLNNETLLKLFDYNNLINENKELNIDYLYEHIILKIFKPHNLTKIFLIVRDEYIIRENYKLNFSNNLNIEDRNNLPKISPFSNKISGIKTFILGDNSYEIHLLSISELCCFLSGICFENAFLVKEGNKNQNFINDYNQFMLNLKKENIKNNNLKPYKKLTTEEKITKLLEPVSLNTVLKNSILEENVKHLNHYKKNWFNIKKITKNSLFIFQGMSYSHINESLLKYFININNNNKNNLINILEGELHLLLHSFFGQDYRKILIESNHSTNPLLYKNVLNESQKNEIQLNSYFNEFKNLDELKDLELNLNNFKDECFNIFKLIFENLDKFKPKIFWDELLNNSDFYNVINIDKIIQEQEENQDTDLENISVSEYNSLINSSLGYSSIEDDLIKENIDNEFNDSD